MLPHGKPNTICIPDYETQENYNDFLSFMTAEGREMASPWAETVVLQSDLKTRGSFQGVPVAFVAVTAGGWKSWCDARQFEYSPLTVTYYATWLSLGSKESGAAAM
jgi:hypothetical protein